MNDGDLIRAVQGGDRASLTTLYGRYVREVWRYAYGAFVTRPGGGRRRNKRNLPGRDSRPRLVRSAPGNGVWLALGNCPQQAARPLPQGAAGRRCHARGGRTRPLKRIRAARKRNLWWRRPGTPCSGPWMRWKTDERLALEWKYADSLSVREIAERLGRTEKAIEAVLYRARASFRAAYARQQARSG